MDQISEIRLFPTPFRNHQAWIRFAILLIAGHGILVTPSLADTHYVSLSGNHIPPFTNWTMAATDIQAAIDVAEPGALILVADGVYDTGGRTLPGTVLTNRVVIDKPIIVQSLNGPEVTIIKGFGPIGSTSVRCVYINSNASLIGFTLTNGHTRSTGEHELDISGGGAWCEPNSVISNCLLTGNSAYFKGGGVRGGTLYECRLLNNSVVLHGGGSSDSMLYNSTIAENNAGGNGGGAYFGIANNSLIHGNYADQSGGGTYNSTLYNSAITVNSSKSFAGGAYGGASYNCTFTGNASDFGGGVISGTRRNCIIYYNTASTPSAANWSGGTISYSCTTPIVTGAGNTIAEPKLASAFRLTTDSPCIGAGSGIYALGFDLDNEAWRESPAIGCDEVYAGGITGALTVVAWPPEGEIVVGQSASFRADILGRVSKSVWDFGDGTIVSNRPFISHVFISPGLHFIVITAYNESYSGGISATVTVQVVEQNIYYVNINNLSPQSPYTNWTIAATNIQDAVNEASQIGALVLVSNGVYKTGGKADPYSTYNRLAIDKQIKVFSVNGPSVTTIEGHGPNGTGAIRCVYVGTNASLAGFTLTSGNTTTNLQLSNQSGGGAWCEPSGMLSNCVLYANSAHWGGGGAWRGTLYNCILSENVAPRGGGVFQSTLYDCDVIGNSGGGTHLSTVFNSVIMSNSALVTGGADGGTLYNSLVIGNSASVCGGVNGATLYNCTVAGNLGGTIGGANESIIYNSIVYGNAAPIHSNEYISTFFNSCTAPLPLGTGNITDNPNFSNSSAMNFDLLPISPCIDMVHVDSFVFERPDMNSYYDVFGRPRLLGSAIDMGAHEFRFEATLRGVIDGAYDSTTGMMRVGVAIPGNSNFAADTTTSSNLPSSAVDWVLIQLRPTPTSVPSTSASAILRKDGHIVRPDGGSPVYLEASGNQHVALFHRNHLAVMSATAVFTNRVSAFDFSADPAHLLGGTNAAVEVDTGVWALIAGDADGDGEILTVDELIWRTQEGEE